MDFQSAMETFAEAWVAANTREQTQALALTRSKSPILLKKERSPSPLQTSQNILRDTTGRTLQETLSPRYGGSSNGGGSGSSSGGVCVGGGGSGVGIGIGIGTNNQQLSSPPTPLSDHHQNLTNNNHQNNNNNNNNSNNNNNNNNQNSNILNNLNNTNHNNNNINNNNINNSINSNQNSHLQHQHHQRNTPNMPASSTTSSSLSSLNNNNNNNHSTNNTQKLCTTPTSSIMENGLIQTQNVANNLTNEKLLQSPSIERKDFDFSKTNAKSLPLHCIVESVSSLQASLSIDTRNLWKRRPNIETDSYVIIAASTPWSDIVTTALQRLGYSMDIANKARGSLVIKNWKPIPLENISDSPVVPVCEILGELTSVVTLRIVILRTKPSAFTEIKDKLLKLLVLQSHAVLRSTGCPLSEVTLSQICRGSYQNSFPFSGDIPEDICRKFDQWWTNQLSPQSPITPKILPFIAPHHQNELDFTVGGGIGGGNGSSNGGGGSVGGVSVGGISGIIGNNSSSHSLHNSRENLLDNHHTTHPNLMVHPALQAIHSQYPNQKTRMRTSFDPEMELPKLQRWFQENPHPSRQQIQSYVIQLNSLESRRGRKPLDVNNVVYWFKNARAAQKRAEMRIQGLGNGYINHQQTGLLLNHPDYMKGSPSMKSDDIDNMSQHSDDIEDDSSRPTSPQLPLSLTTHERNRSTESNPEIKEDNSMNSIERNNNNNNSNNDGCHSTNNNNNNNNNNSRREIVRDIDSNDNNLNSEQRSTSPKNSAKSDDDLDMDDNDMSQLDGFRTPSPDPRRDLTFPMVPNSMFSHSIMYMSHYMPGIGQVHHPHHTPAALNPTAIGAGNLNLSGLTNEERRKRNRTFIDPVTEVPKLEQWFAMNTHPSHNLILKYTEDLNRMPYRQKFPRLESKNVQFWFKNRRAKCKRLKMSLYDQPQCPQLSTLNAFAPKFDTPKFDGTHFDSPKYDERE